MSEQRREISLSFGTLLIVGVLGSFQFEILERVDRLADTADMQMCLEAIKVGIDPMTLPKACENLRLRAEGSRT